MGCGHSVDYYRKRGGYSAVTREVFAELTEQRFNDEANYQFTKSKMPDVVEAYEELYNKIKSGVIKSLKERRG